MRTRFVVFRGQENIKWPLTPKIFRNQNWLDNEKQIIREFISGQPHEFKDDRLMIDKLVRMAHYGLPTRIIDVTENLLVALYFACKSGSSQTQSDGSVFIIDGEISKFQKYYDSDLISVISNISNLNKDEKNEISDKWFNWLCGDLDSVEFGKLNSVNQLIRSIKYEKPCFENRISPDDVYDSAYYLLPSKNNRRIVTQSGSFIVFGIPTNLSSPHLSMRVQKYRIPQINKKEIIQELQAVGINESSLFPELDKLASHIENKFK